MNVCFWHIADIEVVQLDVSFGALSDVLPKMLKQKSGAPSSR